jgi:hypothetical protein
MDRFIIKAIPADDRVKGTLAIDEKEKGAHVAPLSQNLALQDLVCTTGGSQDLRNGAIRRLGIAVTRYGIQD